MENESVSLTKEEYEKLSEQAQSADILSKKLSAARRGIAFDALDDAVMLAASKSNEETDFETAMDEIIAKYPVFAKSKVTTGIETKGSVPRMSGVESAFLRKNPGIKIG
ncbi:MAG: hypothetical protein LBL87_07340 [Ruminococcus sp.]|jgi:hypothetical protein|nr:hypothetical protein [Ruminococcus sp.]